jgi:urease gamma subunit
VRKSIKQKKAHKSCQEVKNKLRVGGILAKVIENMEKKLKTEDFKPSLADYLKLVQLEKDFEDGETKEIKVTWVEPVRSSTET